MTKKDLDEWCNNRFSDFRKIHNSALMACQIFHKKEGAEYPIEIIKEHADNIYFEAWHDPPKHPFYFSSDDLAIRKKAINHTSVYYGGLLAYECHFLARVFWDRFNERHSLKFREDTEKVILGLWGKLHLHMGYHSAIFDIQEKTREQKKNSGIGQKRAMERRVNSLFNDLKTFMRGDNIIVDKSEFYQRLCKQFTGSEKTPRDPKTVKAYKKAIESMNETKIIWGKGTFIPD